MHGLGWRSWFFVLVAPLVAVGCGDAAGESCTVEGLEVCSGDRASILVCEDGELRLLQACGAEMECRGGAEGPACVPTTSEPTLQQNVACAADALIDTKAYLDALIHLLKEVDDPAYDLPLLHFVNWEAGGELGATVDAGIDGMTEQMSGFVRPLDCEGGMFQGDVCVFEWTVKRAPSSDEIAFGTMSASRIAMSEATRYTIVDRNPSFIHSDACRIEVTAFDMMWFVRSDEMYSFQLDFAIHLDGASASTTSGALIWALGEGDPFYWTSGSDAVAPITFRMGEETADCELSLHTFELTCDL